MTLPESHYRENGVSTAGILRPEISNSRIPRQLNLLLDARESEEFAVSHLRDAQLTPSAREALALLADTPKNQLIVAYCSVGYRSAALAQELAARGFTNVYNLEGSLFEWANRGLPVYRDGRSVEKVHPYNWWWGRLLDEKLHSQ